jgi:hypothetical protein
MTVPLQVAQHLEQGLLLSISLSVTDASSQLQESQHSFAVILDGTQPQTLVPIEDLASLLNGKHHLLSSFLHQLPPLVLLDNSIATLDGDTLKFILLLLEQVKASGLIVYHDQHIKGIISLDTLTDALPLSAIPPSNTPERDGLPGNLVTQTRVYTCRKCEMQDPPLLHYLSLVKVIFPLAPNIGYMARWSFSKGRAIRTCLVQFLIKPLAILTEEHWSHHFSLASSSGQ